MDPWEKFKATAEYGHQVALREQVLADLDAGVDLREKYTPEVPKPEHLGEN